MTAATALLPPDPRLPFRDVLLDPQRMGGRLARCLRSGSALDVHGCELMRAKYKVGETVRAVYRLRLDGAERVVAARMFVGGRGAKAYRRAAARAVPSPPLRPVAIDAELDTVLWSFPNDRRLDNLTELQVVPPELGNLLPRRWEATELVAYAPDRAATGRCLDGNGATIAYVKAYAEPDFGRFARVLDAAARHPLAPGRLRVPAVLARSDRHRMLWLEPLGGRPISELDGAELGRGMAALGAALGVLHRLPAAGLPRFVRLDLERIHRAAEVVGWVRPDLGGLAARLAGSLAASRPPRGDPVHLHGDVTPRNLLVDDGRLALIDLDEAGTGQAADELASVLAQVRQDRLLGLRHPGLAAELGSSLLGAYAAVTPLPDAATLRWHTAAALLAERALKAVTRLHADALPHMEALLREATELVAGGDDPVEAAC